MSTSSNGDPPARRRARLRDHEITPVKGSARRLDGTPADLTRPLDFPVEALCRECGRPIRVERYYLAEWRHIERFTIPRA